MNPTGSRQEILEAISGVSWRNQASRAPPPDPPWMEPGWLSCTSIFEEAHLGLSICLHPYGEAAVWSGATGSRFHLGPQQQHRLGSKVVAVTSWLGRVIQVAPFPHVSFYSGLISSYSTFTLQDRTRLCPFLWAVPL